MNKIFKLIGKRGRTTVPFEIRMKMRLGYNSLLRKSTAVSFRRATSAFFMAMWTEIWKMSSRCSIHPSIPEPTKDIHSRFRM